METAERLIVAADFDPRECGGAYLAHRMCLNLAEDLSGTGVIIKVNSLLGYAGYSLIRELQEQGVRVFADLKLVDIPKTMELFGAFFEESPPELLTVMCNAHVKGMSDVRTVLPKTEVLGVTVLTSFDEKACDDVYQSYVCEAVPRLAGLANDAGIGGIVCSPKELKLLKHLQGKLTFNTPGIRPEWSVVQGDDQSRVTTPRTAILNGATRIVVGRPITQARDPRERVLRTLEEMDKALEEAA